MTTFARLGKLADAIRHERYLVNPYQPEAPKNRHRWTVGCLLLERRSAALGEAARTQGECLVLAGGARARVVRCELASREAWKGLSLAVAPAGLAWRVAEGLLREGE